MSGFGGVIKLTGESEYRKALKNITSDLKEMSQSLKAQAAAFTSSDKSVDASRQSQEKLNKTLDAQEKALASAKRSYAQYGVAIQAQTTRHNALSKEFRAAVTELDRVKEACGESSDEYKKQAEVVDKLQAELGESSEKLDANKRAMSDLKTTIRQSEKAIDQTKDALASYNTELSESKTEQNAAKAPMEELNSTIGEQERKLDSLKDEYKNAVLQYGKNSSEAKSLAGEIKSLSGELNDNKSKMNNLDSAADDLDRSLDNVGGTAGTASGKFSAMTVALGNLIADGVRLATGAVKDLAVETFRAGSDFESSMAQVAAVSGATGDDLTALSDKAKEMGEKTKFSATESAEAFNYMAMAGWKTEDMIGGIEGVMNLAAASGEDLATTSDIVTDALTAMGYSAKDAGQLADVMAAASSNANTNVSMMGATFKYAAPIAGALGYSMEDTAVAIGMMANAGIKGEQAGTSLRSVLTRLSAPPKECAEAMEDLGISITNADGTMKPLSEVMEILRGKFSGLSEAQQTQYAKALAGQEAMSGLLAIVNGADADFDKLTDAVNNSSGAAKEMSDTMNDTVQGQITLLKSQIEGKMIKIYENASSQIKKAIKKISSALESIDWDKAGEAVGRFATKAVELFSYILNNSNTVMALLKGIGATIATVFAVNKVSTFATSVSNLTSMFKKTKTAVDGVEGASKLLNATWLASPITWLVAGVGAVVAAYVGYKKKQEEVIEKEYGLSDAQKETIANANEIATAYRNADDARKEAMGTIDSEFGYMAELKDEYNSLIDSNGNVKKGYEDRAEFILTTLASSLGVERDEIEKNIDANGKLGDSIDKVIEKKRAEAVLNANEAIYTEAIKNRADALKKYQDSLEILDSAEKKYNDTKDKANAVMKTYNDLLEYAPDQAGQYLLANAQIIEANEKAEESYKEAKKGVEDAEEAYVGYNSTIQNYEGLSSAIISGDSEKISDALQNMENSFITAENGTKTSLENQVKNLKENYKNMKSAIESNTPGVTQEMVDQAKSMVDKATEELDKYQDKAKESTEKAGDNAVEGFKSKGEDAKAAGKEVGGKVVEGVKENEEAAGQAGKDAGSKYVSNAKNNSKAAKDAGNELGLLTVAGAKSGSSTMNSTGKNSGLLFTNNVKAQKGNAKNAGNEVGRFSVQGAKTGASGMKGAGQKTGQDYSGGVKAQSGNARSSGVSIGNSAKNGAGSVSGRGVGVDFGTGFGNGISSTSGSIWQKAWSLGKSALAAVKNAINSNSPSKETAKLGTYFDQGFALGIDKESKLAIKASMSLGESTLDALSTLTKDITEIGVESGQSFSEALSSNLSTDGFQNQLKGLKVDTQLNGIRANANFEEMKAPETDYNTMVSAFKDALSQMKVELDDEEVGTFIDKTVTRLVYT